jgi:penicillin amidase
MRVLRWTGLALLGLLLLVFVAACGGYLYLRGATLPQHEGELRLAGLESAVEVEREPSGVAHVRAASERDLFFALGAVHAQDRLWQMEFQRRAGAGRLSEVLGEATLEEDRFLRTWGFYRAAGSAYESLGPDGKLAVDSYVEGINAYLDSDPPLPVEFTLLGYEPEPWRPADVLVWAKMMSLDLSTNWDSELQRYRLLAAGMSEERMEELIPPYPEDATTILGSEELPEVAAADGELAGALLAAGGSLPSGLEASNNWVVSGERTASGEPLLANDPHLGLGAPSLWYLAHLESPTLEAVGATLPGLPAVVIGHNREIAWGVTNVGADVQDLYVLEEAGEGYRHDGEARPYEVREEVIEVAGGEPVTLEVRETVYGPVISDIEEGVPGARPLALRWTSLEPEDRTLEAFLGLNRARDWEEFNRALEDYVAPSQNFVYADRAGNIGYVASGLLPVRAEGHTGLVPVPGTGGLDWEGYIPEDERPRTFNPEAGYVVTANNKVTPEDYPYDISFEWAEPYRADRITEMIEARDELTAEDMVEIQQDYTSLLFRDFLPFLERLEPDSEEAARWRDRLLEWDGVATPNSREAAAFAAFYAELTRLPAAEVGEEHWDEPRYLLNALEEGDPNCEPATAEGCLRFASGALDRALERFGGDVPEWGEVHRATFTHSVLTNTPLARLSDREVAFGGDRSTPNVGPYDFEDFSMGNGPGYRQVVDLADLDASLYVHAPGQSGNLLSGNYADLLETWQTGEYLPMRRSGYEVESELMLVPGG